MPKPGTSGKSGFFHVPSTKLQYQAEVQLPEVPGRQDDDDDEEDMKRNWKLWTYFVVILLLQTSKSQDQCIMPSSEPLQPIVFAGPSGVGKGQSVVGSGTGRRAIPVAK